MWMFVVVVLQPVFGQDLRFRQAAEGFAVQTFVSEPCFLAFAVSVFRKVASFDVCGFCPNSVNKTLTA